MKRSSRLGSRATNKRLKTSKSFKSHSRRVSKTLSAPSVKRIIARTPHLRSNLTLMLSRYKKTLSFKTKRPHQRGLPILTLRLRSTCK